MVCSAFRYWGPPAIPGIQRYYRQYSKKESACNAGDDSEMGYGEQRSWFIWTGAVFKPSELFCMKTSGEGRFKAPKAQSPRKQFPFSSPAEGRREER
jgi:hypothetical protein